MFRILGKSAIGQIAIAHTVSRWLTDTVTKVSDWSIFVHDEEDVFIAWPALALCLNTANCNLGDGVVLK